MFVARREKFLDSHMVLKALQQTGTLVSEWSKVFCFKICIYNQIPLELPDKIRLFFLQLSMSLSLCCLVLYPVRVHLQVSLFGSRQGPPALAIGSLEMVHASGCLVVVTTEEAV